MKNKKHHLSRVWNEFQEIGKEKTSHITIPLIEKYISEIFSVGQFYYYVLNLFDGKLTNFGNDIISMHGLKKLPNHVEEILNLIHPEDISFVIEAEYLATLKLKEIGFEHVLDIKSSYCFRMKVNDGSYQLFHHQAIHINKDEKNCLLQAINIHTNINHLTQQNNNIITITGIGNRNDFYQITPKNNLQFPLSVPKLTKREIQIISLIGKGYSTTEISNILNISNHTTHTHRKNIMEKMQVNRVSQLIRKCIEYGYL